MGSVNSTTIKKKSIDMRTEYYKPHSLDTNQIQKHGAAVRHEGYAPVLSWVEQNGFHVHESKPKG